MKEEILQKLENGCNLNDLNWQELDWLLDAAQSNPNSLKED